MYRHHRVNRMGSKARRVVRDLFELYLAEPQCLPREWRALAAGPTSRADRAGRRRLPRRDDRPVCARRASSAVRHLRAGMIQNTVMTNIFGDFRRLVMAALDDLAAHGALPPGSISAGSRSSRRAIRRMAISRPTRRWCSPGQRKTEPDGARREDRRALCGRELDPPAIPGLPAIPSPQRGPVSSISGSTPRCGTRNCARSCVPAQRYGDSTIGGGEPVNVEFVSANPTGPMHVGHGRGAVVGDALARCSPRPGSACSASITSTMPGAQVDSAGALDSSALPRGAGRSGRAYPRRAISRRIPRRNRPRARRTRRRQMARPPRGRVARAGSRFRGRAR